ncbi:MAG: hypothetical protein ACRD3W_09845, partial [Terriglobales bacterium]
MLVDKDPHRMLVGNIDKFAQRSCATYTLHNEMQAITSVKRGSIRLVVVGHFRFRLPNDVRNFCALRLTRLSLQIHLIALNHCPGCKGK